MIDRVHRVREVSFGMRMALQAQLKEVGLGLKA